MKYTFTKALRGKDNYLITVYGENPYFKYIVPSLVPAKYADDDDYIRKNYVDPVFDRNNSDIVTSIFGVTIRSPFLYDTQYAELLSQLIEPSLGSVYFPGDYLKIEIPGYKPEGFEGKYAFVVINKPLTIKEDTSNIYELFENYHNNGIVEILKWTDIEHLNPNDLKKASEVD